MSWLNSLNSFTLLSAVPFTTLNYCTLPPSLYFGFVDLEKAFDRVPREVIRWAMRKLRVGEWLIAAVMSVYTGAETVVRTVCGNSECLGCLLYTSDAADE